MSASIATQEPARILIIGPAWIGDMVMAQGLFKLLEARHPNAALDVLAPGWSTPLLERMPEVRRSLLMPVGHGELAPRARYRLGRALRAAGYDWAIVLPNSLKSALVPWWAGIRRRTGFVGEWRWGLLNDARRLDRKHLPLMVQRFLALGLPPGAPLPEPLPQPALAVEASSVQAALERLQLEYPTRPVLALCPGAEYGPAKRWPPEHFAAIARAKLDEGWSVWLFGSDKDAAIAAEIARLSGEGCVDLAGRTRLAEAIDLLSLAAVAVSNDSGLMHVAAALGRPLIALYGSSTPDFTPPLSERAEILYLKLECSPCFERECPLGHFKCLRDLTPARVLDSIARLSEPCASSS